MKKIFLTAILTAFSFLFSLANAQALTPAELPEWLSAKGYWVVESKKQTPKDAIVYFYTNEHILVYKEEIRNQKLKLNKKKTLLRLKAALDVAILQYEKGSWVHQRDLLGQQLQ